MSYNWQALRRSDTLSPMDTTPDPVRAYTLELADEQVRAYRTNQELSISDRAWNILSTLGLMVYDISEDELKDTLLLGGMDISDPEVYEVAVDFVSLFVISKTINITEPHEPSLYDAESELARRFTWNEELQTRMDKIKFDGMFFREIMVPESEIGQ